MSRMTLMTRIAIISSSWRCVHSLGTTLWTTGDFRGHGRSDLGIRCARAGWIGRSPQAVHCSSPVVHTALPKPYGRWPARTVVVPRVHRTDDDVPVINYRHHKDRKERTTQPPASGIIGSWSEDRDGLELVHRSSGMMSAPGDHKRKVGAA
jgi:hypothetical protein